MGNSKILEVCINADNLVALHQNISTACEYGAKRIELCANMHLGGTTPNEQTTKAVRELMPNNTELLVMIRPHANSFVMSDEDITIMAKQIESAASVGATGVVLGTLTSAQIIDTCALSHLLAIARTHNQKVTFHRAFDACCNQLTALNTLIELGVERVLTSGTPWQSDLDACLGVENIKAWMRCAQGNIEFVIGGGVSPSNAAQLWQLKTETQLPLSLHSYSGVLDYTGRISHSAIEAILNA